jgi:hypothetical protein
MMSSRARAVAGFDEPLDYLIAWSSSVFLSNGAGTNVKIERVTPKERSEISYPKEFLTRWASKLLRKEDSLDVEDSPIYVYDRFLRSRGRAGFVPSMAGETFLVSYASWKTTVTGPTIFPLILLLLCKDINIWGAIQREKRAEFRSEEGGNLKLASPELLFPSQKGFSLRQSFGRASFSVAVPLFAYHLFAKSFSEDFWRFKPVVMNVREWFLLTQNQDWVSGVCVTPLQGFGLRALAGLRELWFMTLDRVLQVLRVLRKLMGFRPILTRTWVSSWISRRSRWEEPGARVLTEDFLSLRPLGVNPGKD